MNNAANRAGQHSLEHDPVAAIVGHLPSPEASFVNGAIVPVDGGRPALGHDPEARSISS